MSWQSQRLPTLSEILSCRVPFAAPCCFRSFYVHMSVFARGRRVSFHLYHGLALMARASPSQSCHSINAMTLPRGSPRNKNQNMPMNVMKCAHGMPRRCDTSNFGREKSGRRFQAPGNVFAQKFWARSRCAPICCKPLRYHSPPLARRQPAF